MIDYHIPGDGGSFVKFARKRVISTIIVIITVASSVTTITVAGIQSSVEHQVNNEPYNPSISVTSLKDINSTRPTTNTLSVRSTSKPVYARQYSPEYLSDDKNEPKRTNMSPLGSSNAMINEVNFLEDNMQSTAGDSPTNTTYSLSFHETGLYSESKWYVNSSGSPSFNLSGPLSGSENSYTVNVPNGSYLFAIHYGAGTAPVSGYFESSYPSQIVINGSSESVSVTFTPLYDVKFTETGLYSGSTWTVNSTSFGSSGPILSGRNHTVQLYNSSSGYAYSVTSLVGAAKGPALYESSYISPVIVNGKNETVQVKFIPYFSVTFEGSGLPGNTKWFMNISGQNSLSSDSDNITTVLPNSSYSYSAASSNKTWKPKTSSGTFKVDGSSDFIEISFVEVTYAVTFSETGLPLGARWFLNLSGQYSLNSTGKTITVDLPNASYNFTIATSDKIYRPSPYYGSFKVDGSNYFDNVTFLEVTYQVAFSETGLPPLTPWYVNITDNPSSGSVTSSTISMKLPNGTYFLSIETANKQYKPIYNLSFVVNGSAKTISITFSLVTYGVIFYQNGLYSGSSWYVNSTGFTSFASSGKLPGSTREYSVSLPNGSYSLTVQYGLGVSPAEEYLQSVYNLSLVVNGQVMDVTINFIPLYLISFTESGLYSTSTWYVNSTGSSEFNSSGALRGSTNSYSVFLPNSSFSYALGYTVGTAPCTSYSISHYVRTFTVQGSSEIIPVDFIPLFSIVFYEPGLPPFASWEIKIGSQTATSDGSYATMLLPNGTYQYRGILLSDLSGEYVSSGRFITNNGKNDINVVFIPAAASVLLPFLIIVILSLFFIVSSFTVRRLRK